MSPRGGGTPDEGRRIVKAADDLIGIPYALGRSLKKTTLDCSQLVRTALGSSVTPLPKDFTANDLWTLRRDPLPGLLVEVSREGAALRFRVAPAGGVAPDFVAWEAAWARAWLASTLWSENVQDASVTDALGRLAHQALSATAVSSTLTGGGSFLPNWVVLAGAIAVGLGVVGLATLAKRRQ